MFSGTNQKLQTFQCILVIYIHNNCWVIEVHNVIHTFHEYKPTTPPKLTLWSWSWWASLRITHWSTHMMYLRSFKGLHTFCTVCILSMRNKKKKGSPFFWIIICYALMQITHNTPGHTRKHKDHQKLKMKTLQQGHEHFRQGA